MCQKTERWPGTAMAEGSGCALGVGVPENESRTRDREREAVETENEEGGRSHDSKHAHSTFRHVASLREGDAGASHGHGGPKPSIAGRFGQISAPARALRWA